MIAAWAGFQSTYPAPSTETEVSFSSGAIRSKNSRRRFSNTNSISGLADLLEIKMEIVLTIVVVIIGWNVLAAIFGSFFD